jgi:hypothetical protein
MKQLLQLEEFAMFLIAIVAFNQLQFDWWLFPALLLLPDLSMVGYLINAKVGAYCYNFVHHKALALLIVGLGFYMNNQYLLLSGIILFAHSSMDRVFGYGLKYITSFNDTHLGIIGHQKNNTK